MTYSKAELKRVAMKHRLLSDHSKQTAYTSRFNGIGQAFVSLFCHAFTIGLIIIIDMSWILI
jgi:hypothetical protein